MDSVISSLIGGLIEGYFSLFFNNFKKEHFQLSTGTTETSTTLHNLEINRDVVREILGIPSLEVTKMCINTLTVKVQVTSIRKVPIVLHVDRLDCILEEPWDTLVPIPTVLEDFLKKLPGGKQSYGMAEKIIDGVTIKVDHLHIQVGTRGKYKTEQRGAWTPPVVMLDIEGISIFTTSHRWDIVDLSSARDYNANRKEIFVFKVFQADSLRCALVDHEGTEIPLIANIPLNVRIVIRKKENNELQALSLEVILDRFQTTVKVEQLRYLASLLMGLSACFGRRDAPALPPATIPHASRIIGIQIRHLSVVALEQSGAGVEFLGKDIRVGTFWGPTSKESEKQVEICVNEVSLREFFSRTGPHSHFIIERDTRRPSKSPADDIVPLPRSFHHDWNVYDVSKPLLYVRTALQKVPGAPAFDTRILLNPLLVSLPPETIGSIADLVSKATPHLSAIQDLHSIKPAGASADSPDEVVVQEGKSPLEELFQLRANLHHISVAFPSAATSDYVRVCLNVADAQLISHPQLAESKLYSKGIVSTAEFPGAPDDLVFTRAQLVQQAAGPAHNVKFNWQFDVEWTVQFGSAQSMVESALAMPRITGDVNISLGRLQEASAEVPYPKLEPLLVEGGVCVSLVRGQLTQQQYQAITSRVDQVMLLLPILRKLGSTGQNLEKPKVPLVFLVHVDKLDFTLCNNAPHEGAAPEPLAKLDCAGVEVCVEVTSKRQVVKAILQRLSLTALPDHPTTSQLFNSNHFIHTGSGAPLVAFRFKNIDHPQGRLLEETCPDSSEASAATTMAKYLGNRAFYAGPQRSQLDVHLNSLYSGINPNPACNILNFFLKTQLNVKGIIAGLREVKKSLDDVDLSEAAAGFAADFTRAKVEDFVESAKHALDIDVCVDVRDTRIYLVQDVNETEEGQIRGDVALSVDRVLFGRRVETEYKHSTYFKLDNVHVTCNKEEATGAVVASQSVFSPVSCSFRTEREWLVAQKQWNMTVGGFFDKIELEVTPSHARVFMDVVHGIKIKNVQQVVTSVSEYATRVKAQLPAIREQITESVITRVKGQQAGGAQPTGEALASSAVVELDEKALEINSILSDLEQMNGWAVKAKTQIKEAQADHQRLAASMDDLEERTGEANILGSAACQGVLSMVVGRKLCKRYAAISKKGTMCVFNDQTGGKPLVQIKITPNTQLGMIDKITNGFQVQTGTDSAIFSAPDDMAMMQWTNAVLKLQVAGHSEFQAQTADVFSQAVGSVEQINTYMDRISNTAQELKDQAKLLARISALEKLVKEKDAQIASLKQ